MTRISKVKKILTPQAHFHNYTISIGVTSQEQEDVLRAIVSCTQLFIKEHDAEMYFGVTGDIIRCTTNEIESEITREVNE